MPRSLAYVLAALALLTGCAGKGQPASSGALPAAPAVLPQARAALADGQYAAAVALAGPWSAIDPAAASLVAEARLAEAEAALDGPPDSAAARRRNSFNTLALAISIAPKGELRDRIAARMADLAHTADPTSAAAPPAPHAASPAARPQPARPRPPPQAVPPTYVVAQRKSFDGSGERGRFESCVDVQVIGRGGPVAGAVVGVNNGEHSYQSQTNGDGYTGRCGLGASTWSVVLFWTPGGDSGVATTVYLSGAAEQRAAVVFQER